MISNNVSWMGPKGGVALDTSIKFKTIFSNLVSTNDEIKCVDRMYYYSRLKCVDIT